MTNSVRELLRTIATKLGLKDVRPHRFRDSFAVRCLINGVPLEDVSQLLCHQSVAVTQKYYAAWVPERKLRLERLLAESLVDTPSS